MSSNRKERNFPRSIGDPYFAGLLKKSRAGGDLTEFEERKADLFEDGYNVGENTSEDSVNLLWVERTARGAFREDQQTLKQLGYGSFSEVPPEVLEALREFNRLTHR